MPIGRQLRAAARRLLDRRYATAHLRRRLARERRPDDPITVFQMGKVGSETVVASLEAAGVGVPVHHVHALSDEATRAAEQIYRRSWVGPEGTGHLWEAMALRRRLADEAPEAWRVVTLTRDPVARNVSSFFQVGGRQYGLDHAALLARTDEPGLVAELTAAFLEGYAEHDEPIAWWDRELRGVFGADVRDLGFDPDVGWARRRLGRADLLLVALERLGEVGPAALGAFVGRASVPLVARNRGADKETYGAVYRRFVDEVVLPDDYLDLLYDHEVTRLLHSPAQLDAFRRRWRRTATT